MQTQQPPVVDSPYQESSHLNASAFSSATSPLGLPTIYTEHCAPASDAAFERCTGRAMQSLSLPPPTSLPSTPFGRRQEPGNNLVPLPSQFSPGRSEQYSYPSPPMSDSHSPARRSAQIVDPERHPFPPPLHEPRKMIGIAPPPQHAPSLLDPRSSGLGQGHPQHRPLYQADSQPRTQPPQYQPPRRYEASYGGYPAAQNYAYGYPAPEVPSYLGAQGVGPGPQVQPAAMLTPQSVRQSKPARRTKAHVASACVNCKKAHLSCDVQRPCGRCVASGKQDTCKDVQHKKRGRPRLRDDKDFGRSDEARMPAQISTQLLGPLPLSGEFHGQQSPFSTMHRGSESHRVLESSRDDRQQPLPTPTGGHSSRLGSYAGEVTSPYSAGPPMPHHALPIAFLNLDLVVQKSSQSFQDLVSFLGDVRGQSLSYFLESRQSEVLHRLRTELRDERDEREPTYMAPITPVGSDPMQAAMQTVSERDVEHVSQGFTDRPFLLNFRLPNNQHQTLQTQIRLAKTSLYFVTLVVHTPPRPVGPPLLTQQLAPPTPTHASQTRSAPTNAPSRDFGSYSSRRPSSSASSAPTSPYYNFTSVRTSLPAISSSSYGSSPSYGYPPTVGPEQGYFPTYQSPSQPGAYPSGYPSAHRTGSVTSEPQFQPPPPSSADRPARLEGLHLPPLRTIPAPPPLASPLSQEFGEGARDREPRVKRRESPLSAESQSDTPEAGKRRRLNIHEVLE
ncbi:unnamed protein product [Periconia digitata]|uniref:Zn(2)-C6 fungal-type domain-containing protein n=1 Tax=Periconia digitata TaxID=1303443 RepID=A0A9W4U1Y1_9PLEO|nr:unnamed protein product [Periconia digitata]